MGDTKVNITAPGEYILREGKFTEPKPLKSIQISGVLDAPAQFLKGRGEFDQTKAHLEIFHEDGELVLYIQDTDPDTSHVIKGSMSLSQDLQYFNINGAKRWEIREFLAFARVNRYWFADKEQHATLINGLTKWTSKIEVDFLNHNDNKGNTLSQLETKVRATDGFVGKFDLLIPIFKGYDKVRFTVEIGLEVKNTSVVFYLYSDELVELMLTCRETYITAAVQAFKDYTFSQVVVN